MGGTYTIIVTDVNGCTNTSSTTLTVNTLPTASASNNGPLCAGQTLTLTGGPNSLSSYSWTGPDSYSSSIQSPTVSASATTAMTGTYTITVTDGNGCSSTASTNATVYALPTANAGVDLTICDGSSIALDAGASSGTPTLGYFWDNSLGSGVSHAVSPSSITTYNVTVTDGNACTDTDDITVTVNTPATVDAGSDASICENETYTLAGSIGGSAGFSLWTTSGDGSFDDNTNVTATYTPGTNDIANGSVTLTLETDDPSGPCTAVTDDMVLTINAMDDAGFNYSSGTFCQTGTDPTPTINLPGGAFTFSPAGLSINSSTGEIDLLASTVNTYTVTYTTNGTCPNSSSVNITITSSASAEFNYPMVDYCSDDVDPAPVFGSGASAGNFTVSPAGLVFVNSNTGVVDLSASTAGSYIVTNNIPASGGCAAALDTTQIVIYESAQVAAGNDATMCETDQYLLSGASIAGSTATVTWSTLGDGLFDDNTLVNATYVPGATDISSGLHL